MRRIVFTTGKAQKREPASLAEAVADHFFEAAAKQVPVTIGVAVERCPRCGRPASFSYSSAEAAKRKAPLCWGESERDCPGWLEYAREVATDRPSYIGDAEFAACEAAAKRERGKVYECYVCNARSEPIAKGKPLGWQMGHAAFDSTRGVWWGRAVRCPKHRAEPRRGAPPDATLTTLGEMLMARMGRA